MAEEDQNTNFNPAEWNDIKSRYNKAKSVLQNIADLHVKFESAQVSLKATQTEVERISNDSRERFTTIENAKNDSATFLAEIKGNLEKVQSSIVSFNEGMTRFEGIKGKIEGKEGEIETLVSTANSLKADIEKQKAEAQKHLDSISDLFTKVQEKISDMDKAYTTFVEIRAKILDDKTGLQAILDQAQTINTQSQTVLAEITNYREESKKYLEEIKTNKENSSQMTEEIKESLESAQNKKLEVEKIADLITDTGFANSFQKRQKSLRINSFIWLGIFFLSIIGLSILLYKFFGKLDVIPEIQYIIYRLTLTSPLLLLIGFSIKQYGNERTLEERYAFKATMATVMRNHADFLIEKMEKTDAETGIFIRQTIGNLYSEPFETGLDMKKINKELKSILDKDTDKKFSITDIVNKVKELKELIPDEALLKSIIDVLIKFK